MMRHRVTFFFNVCQTIRNRPVTFDIMQQSMMGRVRACIDAGGGESESFVANRDFKTLGTEQLLN